MNKELSNKIFKIPKHVLDKISDEMTKLKGEDVPGIERATNLLNDKTVTYGQLKRIIHDLNTMDKLKYKQKYELAGGDLMMNWSNNFLKGERDLVKSRKDSRRKADSMSAMTGERKNSHLGTHKKKSNFNIGTGGSSLNFMKNNSQKTSTTDFSDLKLFEEVEKIKKLITY
jgi:hypothetical protein